MGSPKVSLPTLMTLCWVLPKDLVFGTQTAFYTKCKYSLIKRCMATWKTSWSRKIKLGWRKILWRTAKAKSETWSWKNEHTWSGSLWRTMEIRQIWRSGQNIFHFWRLLSWPGKLTFSWIHHGWNLTWYNLDTLKFYPRSPLKPIWSDFC